MARRNFYLLHKKKKKHCSLNSNFSFAFHVIYFHFPPKPHNPCCCAASYILHLKFSLSRSPLNGCSLHWFPPSIPRCYTSLPPPSILPSETTKMEVFFLGPCQPPLLPFLRDGPAKKPTPTSPLTWMAQNRNNQVPNFSIQAKLLNTNKSSQKNYMNSRVDYSHENSTNLAAIMLSYAENGCVEEAQMVWDVILNSSFIPSAHLVSSLMISYAKSENFELISEILSQIKNRRFSWLPKVYSLAIKCFGIGGRLDRMEQTLDDMVSMGFRVNSVTGNAYVVYYSKFSSLGEMEAAYGRLKKSQILLEEEGIRAVSFAYMRENKFYLLGEFLRDVGLGRRNVGNLLWNLLLLSYAAKFKMKSLQREFLAMLEAGFQPDLTTFNIRALAFSKMSLFWDLHLSLDHMRHENVVPDLVTYGCVVDAYMDKRMGRNLDFALNKMFNFDECPSLGTDLLVIEVMGKGDFLSNSEAFMEFNEHKSWTYRKLTGLYVKKRHRSNQVFWNY